MFEKTKIKLLWTEFGCYTINSKYLWREPWFDNKNNFISLCSCLSRFCLPDSPHPGVTLLICSQSDGFCRKGAPRCFFFFPYTVQEKPKGTFAVQMPLDLQGGHIPTRPSQAENTLRGKCIYCTYPPKHCSLASCALNVLRYFTLARLGQITLLPWPSVTREHGTRIASLGKDQNSKFEFEFLLNMYCFQSIVKSNCKLNHRKSGTVWTAVKCTN